VTDTLSNVVHVNPNKASKALRKRERFGVVFWIASGFVGIVIFLALFCQWLPIQNPITQDFLHPMALPSWHHLFGTDDLGRDTFARVVYGARVSVLISFGTMGIGLLVGGSLGMIAAYRGGTTDLVLNSAMIVGISYPSFIAVLIILGLWQPISMLKMILILGIFSIPLVFILIRGATMSYATREFVLAARALGATNGRILRKEILPNVSPAAMTVFLLGIANVVVIEGSLSFLGKGISVPTASWGNMLNEGAGQFTGFYTGFQQYELAFFPAITIFLYLVSLFIIGDKLRARYDVGAGRLS
jgi:peptide/nickel transport system permease protein